MARTGFLGQMRIGDMPLFAMHGEPAGQRAAPADLDHLALHVRVGRLAQQAMIEGLARAFAQSSSFTVPLMAGPSSSPVTRQAIEPGNAGLSRTKVMAAAAMAASPPFHVAGPAAMQHRRP